MGGGVGVWGWGVGGWRAYDVNAQYHTTHRETPF